MRFFPLLAFLVAVEPVLADAEHAVIRSIHLQGNRAVTEMELREAMTLRPGMLLSPAQLAQDLSRLSDLYRRQGYYSVEIDVDSTDYSADSSSVRLAITFREGVRLSLGSIEVSGNSLFNASEILSRFATRPGGVLQEEILERDIADLLQRYDQQGYPFARAQVRDLAADSTGRGLRLTLAIEEGARTTIEEIRIRGNTETHDDVITREAGIALHEPFQPAKMRRILQRLNRLNIFARVDEPELFVSDKGGGVLISVQEGNANTLDGVIGYAPARSSGESGVVTGFLNVGMRNLFGTGRRLAVRWQRDGRETQEISVRYVEPWVAGLPLTASIGLVQRQQDSSYVQRTLETGTDLLLTEVLSVGLVANFDEVIPSSDVSRPVVSESHTTAGGVTLRYDTRDDPSNPASGVNCRTLFQVGSKSIASGAPAAQQGSTTVRTLSADADLFVSPFPRQVIAFGIHGREHDTDRPTLSDLVRLGGTSSVRGYRENQFLGTRVAWTNTEYRFLLARRSFVFGFLDSGYAFLPADDNNASSQQIMVGYGMGIRLETSLGNVGVSLGFGEGDSFTEGKIHIGLVNDF